MGLIGRVLGMGSAAREVGTAVGGVAEIFIGNRAERDAAAEKRVEVAVGQLSAEFAGAGDGRFDRFVNALNRLPRPLLTLGTIALFVYSMAAPAGFSTRMEGLALVPEPLWWLLGAIVSFYFGARELHHQRARATALALPRIAAGLVARTGEGTGAPGPDPAPEPGLAPGLAPAPLASFPAGAANPDRNDAVEEWRRLPA